MEFKTRISYKVAITMVMALFIIAFEIFNVSNIPDPWNFAFILLLLFLVFRVSFYSKYIYLFLTKKPALVITENCVYDAVNDKNFHRDEIATLYEDNGYLCVKLIELVQNNENDHDMATPFKINLELVKIDDEELIKIINNFHKTEQNNETQAGSVNDISYYIVVKNSW